MSRRMAWHARKVATGAHNSALGAVYVSDRGRPNVPPFDLATGAIEWLTLSFDTARHERARDEYRRSAAICFDEIARRNG